MAQLKDLIVNGPSRFIGDVYATTFTGNLAGNASTATSATNAGMIAGLSVHSGRNNEANKIVRTDGNGYLQVGYINSSSGHEKNASNPTYVWGSNSSDSYLRSYQTSSLSVNYATTSGACTGNAATATNASSAGNADKLDGVHYQNILERHYSGSASSGTATGWFRIAETLVNEDYGPTFLLAIQRSSSYIDNESYLFSISISFGGGISITQLSGYANTRLITKIRIDWDHSQIAYVDLYINTSSTNNNYYWYTIGCAKSYTTWTANPTLVGYAHTFTTVQGCKSDKGFTGYLTGTASSSSKWTYARTITLTGSVTGSVSIDGSQNVSLATTTNHTHTFTSLTSKPTTISGYGITDGLRKVTLANNVENDFNTFENLTLTGRGDPTTGSSLLNSPWTTQPAGGFGVLTYLWSGYGLQLAAGYASNDLYIRNKCYTGGGSNWDTRWDRILNSSNFNSYTPKLDGTGASGTWGINISGNADTLDGQHNIEQVSDWNSWVGSFRISAENTATNAPADGFHYGYQMQFHRSPAVYYTDLITNLYSDKLYYRRHVENGYGAWKQIAFLDSNVASATKLQNSRTIWGRSFDGTGNVDGRLILNYSNSTGTTGIEISSTNGGEASIGFKLNSSTRAVVGCWNNRLHMWIEGFGSVLSIPSSGYVGIGTISPSYKLHVAGAIRASDYLSTQYIELIGSTPFIDFHYNNSTDDYTSRIIEGLSGQLTVTGKLRVGLNYATSTDYAFHVAGAGYFTDNVITESDFSSRGNAIIDGYVGIGIQNPSYKLDVAGAIHATTDIMASGHAKVNSLKTQYICIECDDSGKTAGHTSEINNYSRPLYIQYSTSNNCCICYGGGNVGIGIASPTYKLHVDGDARINGTISCIKLSQTSDIKYKTNIKQIEYEEALKIIENLNPVTWDWNENTVETGSSSGFVAQEAEEFIPNAISRDNENNLSLDYTQLHSYEIKVIQEQQKEIIKLKEKLKILEKLIS